MSLGPESAFGPACMLGLLACQAECRTQDSGKPQLGQRHSEQLSLKAGGVMRRCARAMCS